MKKDAIKYKGLTKRNYKRVYKSSTSGSAKGENCHATPLDKALAKYPRAYRTMPDEYISFNLKKDRVAKRDNTYFTRNFKPK